MPTCFDTIKRAAQAAANFAWPNLHPDTVHWDDEETLCGDANITLSVVSEVDEDPDPIRVLTRNDQGSFDVAYRQRAICSVNFVLESTESASNSKGVTPPRYVRALVRRFRLAWETAAVGDILASSECPVVVVDMGDIQHRAAGVGGIALPTAAFEIRFRGLFGEIEESSGFTVGEIKTLTIGGTTQVPDPQFTRVVLNDGHQTLTQG